MIATHSNTRRNNGSHEHTTAPSVTPVGKSTDISKHPTHPTELIECHKPPRLEEARANQTR